MSNFVSDIFAFLYEILFEYGIIYYFLFLCLFLLPFIMPLLPIFALASPAILPVLAGIYVYGKLSYEEKNKRL